MAGLGERLRKHTQPRTLELIALRVSARTDCVYVWRGHVEIALHLKRDALSEADVAGVAVGPEALSGRDRLVVATIDQVLTDGCVDEGARRELADAFVQVTIGTAFYLGIVTLMAGHEPEPNARRTPGLETPARARATFAGQSVITAADTRSTQRVGS